MFPHCAHSCCIHARVCLLVCVQELDVTMEVLGHVERDARLPTSGSAISPLPSIADTRTLSCSSLMDAGSSVLLVRREASQASILT